MIKILTILLLFYSTSLKAVSEEKNHHEQPLEAFGVYFIVICMLIGAICRQINKFSGIPYTPLLLLSGITLGRYYLQLGDIGTAINLFLQINPHGILYIFIPTIIFESAFNIDPFVFKKEIFQVIILAGPGVIIGAILTALSFRYILSYEEFLWSQSFILSSIVCATDPVAVVALLKELGTSTKFKILLEGESLLNDGTSMVFFIMFSEIYKGVSQGVGGILFNFIQLTLGGVVVGMISCFILINWMKRIVRDDILYQTLTFMFCYLTFFISEFYLGVSGIIAIVTLGVLMSQYGKINMNHESNHSLHSVWTFIQYVLETILFIATGIFIGREFLADTLSSITQEDLIKVCIFFFLITIIRLIMLMLLKGTINQYGWPITQKDIVVLTYGGLRGAIALSLALMVTIDDDYPTRFREIVLFYISAMIFFTVLINGLSIKYVIKKIGFQQENEIQLKIKHGIQKQLIIEMFTKKSRILQNKFLKLADWDEILKISGIKEDIQNLKKFKKQQIKKREREMVDLQENLLKNKQQAVIETRIRFYQILKCEIQSQFEEGTCSKSCLMQLIEVVNLCSQELERPVWIWECISSEFVSVNYLQKLMKYLKIPIIGHFAKSILTSQLLYSYEWLSVLVISLKNIANTKRSLPINLDYIKMVFSELSNNLKSCQNHLFHFIELFPDLAKAIQEKNAATLLLNTQKHLLDQFLMQGSITEDEHQQLRSKFQRRIKNISVSIDQWEIPDIDILSLLCPSLSKLNKNHLDMIQKTRKLQRYQKGETLLFKNKISTGILIIQSGTVKEKDGFRITTYGIGSIISFANLVNPTGNALADIKAESAVTAIFIPNQTLIHIMSEDLNFEEEVYRQSLYQLFTTQQILDYELDEQKINYILDRSEFHRVQPNTLIEMKDGGFVFSGTIKEIQQRNPNAIPQQFSDCSLVNSSQNDFKSIQEVKLLKFGFPIKKTINEDEFRASLKMSFQRDSFVKLSNIERDIDRLYNMVEKRVLTDQK